MLQVLKNIRQYNLNYRKPLEIARVDGIEVTWNEPVYNYRHRNLIAEHTIDKNYSKRYLIGRRLEKRFGDKLICTSWEMNRLQFAFHDTVSQMEKLEIMDWYIKRYGEIDFELNSKRLIVRI